VKETSPNIHVIFLLNYYTLNASDSESWVRTYTQAYYRIIDYTNDLSI
jgi:hypothetical protein